MNDNDANPLLELRDIYAAPQPPWWPPAPGWWLVAVLLAIVLFFLLRKLWGYYQRWRQRRWVLNYLAQLYAAYRTDQDQRSFAAEVSMLLRRVALSRFPPRDVAALSDEPWLSFLDLHSGNSDKGFSTGAGQVLMQAPYAAPNTPASELDAAGLYQLARHWVKHVL